MNTDEGVKGGVTVSIQSQIFDGYFGGSNDAMHTKDKWIYEFANGSFALHMVDKDRIQLCGKGRLWF